MNQKKLNKLFSGREMVIATKHHKEKVIAPLFEMSFNLTCFVPENFDTDLLGTFTGEVERKSDPVITLRNKCQQAMDLYNCDLGIASEGSFGLHPNFPFLQADDEFLIFIDKKNDLEIIERELSLSTNFHGCYISTEKELIEFANLVKFPTHALIIQKSAEDLTDIIKGITNWDLLKESFNMFLQKHESAYLITDMRALYNPTRMQVIQKVTKKLIIKINSCCPECQTPGFGIKDSKRGLICELCGLPTRSILSYIFRCEKCSFTKEELYPNRKKYEDPMFCDYCNP